MAETFAFKARSVWTMPTNNADICFEMAGKVGIIWRRYRKKAPPDVRDALAEVLLRLRLHIVPAAELDGDSNIGRARYDIRGVTQLLRRVANDVHVPHEREEIVHVPKIIHQVRVVHQTVEQIVDVLTPMMHEEIV